MTTLSSQQRHWSLSRIWMWPVWMVAASEHDRRQRTESRPPDLERRQPEWPSHHSGGGDQMALPLWLQAIKTLGTTGAIAVFLVWVGSNELPKIARQTEVNAQTMARLAELLQQKEEREAAMFRMVQRLCVNTAKNEDDRTRCFEK